MTTGEIAYLTTAILGFVAFALTLAYQTWNNNR